MLSKNQLFALRKLIELTDGSCSVRDMTTSERAEVARLLAGGPVPDSRTGVNEIELALVMIGAPLPQLGDPAEPREVWLRRFARWVKEQISQDQSPAPTSEGKTTP